MRNECRWFLLRTECGRATGAAAGGRRAPRARPRAARRARAATGDARPDCATPQVARRPIWTEQNGLRMREGASERFFSRGHRVCRGEFRILLAAVGVAGGNEAAEERMRLKRFGLELG